MYGQPAPNAATAGQAPVAAPPSPEVTAAAAPDSSPYAATRPPTPDLILRKQQCLLAPVCLGPMATIFSTLGTFGLGVRASYGDYLGASIDYQLLPTIDFSKISIGTGVFSATARVYPFKGKFFAGAGFGYMHMLVRVRSNDDIDAEMRVGAPIFILNVGFTGRSGFVFGMDASLLVPMQKLRAKIKVNPGSRADDIPQDELDNKREQFASDVNKALGKIPLLLQLNLVRIGYIF
jgi:hypothetical protein